MTKKDIWVSPSGNKWIVQKEGGQVVSEHYKKEPAKESGRRQAREDGVELIEQNRWGQIVSKDSFGNESSRRDLEH